MGFKDFAKNVLKSASRAGEVNGSEFPIGTYINFGSEDGENYMLFTYPNNEEEKITHDMIQSATVLAMGVMDIKQESKGTTLIHGTKYLCVLKDGRQAVLTVGLGKTQYRVEKVLF
jgi:calcineurin-like phosphoesterase family protein